MYIYIYIHIYLIYMFEFSNESKTAKQMLHRLRVQSSLLSKLFFFVSGPPQTMENILEIWIARQKCPCVSGKRPLGTGRPTDRPYRPTVRDRPYRPTDRPLGTDRPTDRPTVRARLGLGGTLLVLLELSVLARKQQTPKITPADDNAGRRRAADDDPGRRRPPRPFPILF